MMAMWLLRRVLRYVVRNAGIASFGDRPWVNIQIITENGEHWRIAHGKFLQTKGPGWPALFGEEQTGGACRNDRMNVGTSGG